MTKNRDQHYHIERDEELELNGKGISWMYAALIVGIYQKYLKVAAYNQLFFVVTKKKLISMYSQWSVLYISYQIIAL